MVKPTEFNCRMRPGEDTEVIQFTYIYGFFADCMALLFWAAPFQTASGGKICSVYCFGHILRI